MGEKVEKIEAWKTPDGRVWQTREAANEHMRVRALFPDVARALETESLRPTRQALENITRYLLSRWAVARREDRCD